MEELRIAIRRIAEEVYAELGPGHSEVTYRKAMEHMFRENGFKYDYEVPMPTIFRGTPLTCGFADLMVRSKDGPGRCVIELKAVATDQSAQWEMQLNRYLQSCRNQGMEHLAGMVINFPQKPRAKGIWANNFGEI